MRKRSADNMQKKCDSAQELSDDSNLMQVQSNQIHAFPSDQCLLTQPDGEDDQG